MRTRLSFVVALMTAFAAATAFAQSERTPALHVADGIVFLDDRPIDASSLPSVLPENAGLRTERGRAAIVVHGGPK